MIRAIHFPNADTFRATRLPGSTHFNLVNAPKGEAALWFFCPCGCGAPVRLRVGMKRKPPHSPSWDWNGSVQNPTLSPSVNRLDCGWHGWLRGGYWEEV
ncbi:DUF6527 family protein [Thalassovita sp.]|uniref:DUF6527 family protein n=1 Tax=Thalassovita sp. TaxID=1979401 RepID=UPI002B26662F|nr:DUF6527 family protein [Thalassovita sp.]